MQILPMRRKLLDTCSIGFIELPEILLHTIERPWVCDDLKEHRGGKPFESCVPYGHYELVPHEGNKYTDVWALVNPALGVYHYKHEMLYDTDRYGILIHWGNWVHNVVGCIATGFGATYDPTEIELNKRHAVTSSRKSINYLRSVMATTPYTHLEIMPFH